MLGHKRRWHYFDEGLLAINAASAEILKNWYQSVLISGEIPVYFEMIDLQRYKKVDAVHKVRTGMKERAKEPFVFFPCKN